MTARVWADEVKHYNKSKIRTILLHLMILSVFAAYIYTREAWIINLFGFYIITSTILIVLSLAFSGIIIAKVVNSDAMEPDERGETLYTLIRNMNIAKDHGFYYLWFGRITTLISLLVLASLGHFVIAGFMLVSLIIALIMNAIVPKVKDSFSPQEIQYFEDKIEEHNIVHG